MQEIVTLTLFSYKMVFYISIKIQLHFDPFYSNVSICFTPCIAFWLTHCQSSSWWKVFSPLVLLQSLKWIHIYPVCHCGKQCFLKIKSGFFFSIFREAMLSFRSHGKIMKAMASKEKNVIVPICLQSDQLCSFPLCMNFMYETMKLKCNAWVSILW